LKRVLLASMLRPLREDRDRRIAALLATIGKTSRLMKAQGLVAAIALAAVAASSAQAGVIVGATSVTSPQGDFGSPYDLINVINQSGLSAGYTSFVTDFDTFVAATTHDGGASLNSGFTNIDAPPGQFSFDLGAVVSIDALAFWEVQNSGSVHSFNLYADNDQDFTNGVGPLIGSFSATGGGFSGPAVSSSQVFTFAAVSTEFVHIDVLTMEGGTALVPGIGEVAFRAAVPEPATLALVGLGLAGLGFSRRKQ
jgi:hypothetical protein